jgi:hypothetical protein
MSSEYPPPPNSQESLYGNMKLSNSSPTSQLANSALAYVASSANAGLENIEPSLAAMSSHTAIQPAPPADDGVGQFHSNGGATAEDVAMGPTSGSAEKVDHDFINQDPSAPTPDILRAKRLNRACDACSKRKVKVRLLTPMFTPTFNQTLYGCVSSVLFSGPVKFIWLMQQWLNLTFSSVITNDLAKTVEISKSTALLTARRSDVDR